MMNNIKTIIRNFFHILKLDVKRYNPALTEAGVISSILKSLKIDLVLDIGSNIGQFAMGIRSAGYKNNIVSFEPLSDAYSVLLKNIAKDDLWIAHDRCAIGSYDGMIIINVAGNSVSSSILPMMQSHIDAAPNSNFFAHEEVSIFKLDSIANNYIQSNQKIFLKIDTQGYEWNVLDGASESFDKVQGVLLELSFIYLYEGQHLWLDMVNRMESLGFKLWTLIPGFSDLKTGRTLQADAIFVRNFHE